LDIAVELKPLLQNIDGFISIERFSSLMQEGKILSLSFWRDEKAIEEWRNTEAHRFAQKKGRGGVFADYRLRIATVIRDYGMETREQAPSDSKLIHDKSNS
jgi:heme-degrading monooxygenase HmoA